MSFVDFQQVRKTYMMGDVPIHALKNATFQIEKGEICVIVGPSGAGKTTLLNILGGMDSPTEGTVILGDHIVSDMNRKQLTEYRRLDIGFVFQFYNLLQNLTAIENVKIASELADDPLPAKQVLEWVGLKDRKNNFPAQLSGGEQQRVAIARALAKNPQLMLCDEPTGALDYNTGKAILTLLQKTCKETGMTLVIVTHNSALTAMANRVIHVKNGQVSSVTCNDNPKDASTLEW